MERRLEETKSQRKWTWSVAGGTVQGPAVVVESEVAACERWSDAGELFECNEN